MRVPRALVVAACACAAAGCASTAYAPEPVTIERPRIGAAPTGADAALYFDIRSSSDDRLVGAETEAASTTSLHEMREVEGGGIMASVDTIELPAGVLVGFQPFGDHVMLEDLNRDLEVGDLVTITLSFEERAEVDVDAIVVDLIELAEEGS